MSPPRTRRPRWALPLSRRTRLALRVLAGLALGIALLFALRLVLVVTLWGPAAERPIQGWMTPRYVVRSYDLPPEAVAEVLGIEPGSAAGQSIESLARAQDRPLIDVLRALDALRAAQAPQQ